MNTLENNRDRYFKGQQDHEELICFFRKHWITLVPLFAFYGFAIALTIFFIFGMERLIGGETGNGFFRILVMLGILFITILVHRLFLRLFTHHLSISIITNLRVVSLRKAVFLDDEKEAADLSMIQDIQKYQRGLLENFLGYGEIFIRLAAANATLCLTYVPNPEFHFRVLHRAKESYLHHGRHPQGLSFQPEMQEIPETENPMV